VKFTPAGGKIRVHTFEGKPVSGNQCEPRICIKVSDNGIGFPPYAEERIFEPFEQVASEERYRIGGMGLGLAITRTVVELHKGVIRAESPGEGLGAIFTVELPRSNRTWGASELPHYRGGPGDRREERPMRLLVVEDHEPTLRVLARLLTSSGHTVVTASSVAEARRCVREQPVDFVISDLGLPDGNGIELMKGLRDSCGLRGIALSGFGMEEDLQRSHEAGFVAHLVKPVDFNELRRTLSRFGIGQDV
jgi:CheY-like chemotaxis protein